MQPRARELKALLEPIVVAMGYELVGVDFRSGGNNALLRVYIDKSPAITVDDCALVSHQVSGLLDVENSIPGAYTLEVSSPGLDRPLFEVVDYQRFSGHKVRIQLVAPIAGQRKFVGMLRGVEDGKVILEIDQQKTQLPLDLIEKGRLVPEL